MKKVVAVLAVMAAAGTAHAQAPWYNNGRYPVRDAAVATATGVAQGADAAIRWTAEQAINVAKSVPLECTLTYKKQGGVILVGGFVGDGTITCQNAVWGRVVSRADLISIEVGPQVFIGSEEGELHLYGVGSSVEAILGLIASGHVRYANGQGQAAGLAAALLAGRTEGGLPGAGALVGYFHGTTTGWGAGASVGLTGFVGSRVQQQQQQQQQQGGGGGSQLQQQQQGRGH